MSGIEFVVFVLMFVGSGAVFLAIGLALLFWMRRFLRTAVRTPAKVVGYEVRSRRSGGGSLGGAGAFQHAKVEFEDLNGRKRCVTMNTGSTSRPHPQGAQVDLLYNPDNPEEAQIESFLNQWLFPLAAIGVGGVLLIIGLVATGVRGCSSTESAAELKRQGSQQLRATPGASSPPAASPGKSGE